MKKFIIMAAIILFGLVACKPKVDHYDFNRVVIDDYSYVTEKYDSVWFYEAQARYDQPITSKKAKVVWVYTVFGLPDNYTITITHEEGAYTEAPKVQVYDSPWLEDIRFNPDVPIDLPTALSNLKSSESVPETELVVLRRPLWYPMPEAPYYIFGGTKSFFMKVNAINGEVSPVNSEEVEESEE